MTTMTVTENAQDILRAARSDALLQVAYCGGGPFGPDDWREWAEELAAEHPLDHLALTVYVAMFVTTCEQLAR